MKVLILGAAGMLGNAMIRTFREDGDIETWGTLRGKVPAQLAALALGERLLQNLHADQADSLRDALTRSRPDLVINCIGLVKQFTEAEDPLQAVPVNTLLPHQLARLCEAAGARLVHMSTDCVFSGEKGNYRETDVPDAKDVYGRSKLLGEVDYPHAITLRTSIIGHELNTGHALVEWFLSQHDECRGFTRAIFSGLPTVALARVVRDYVIPNPELRGVYHVAAEPISKYDLLKLIADVYGKRIRIVPDDSVVIDRSLNGSRFARATGFHAPPWQELVSMMHAFR
jgi:dTDP-4-dehydrorhamnose reductase